MITNEISFLADAFGVSTTAALIGFLFVAAWSLVWKGLALWASARGEQQGWFIAILIINTMGILEIVYLLFFRKKDNG